MPADREKFPLPERIFLAFTAVSRWATSASLTSADTPGSRRGCANPLALFKVLLFLLMIVLLPIFILPMMLARLATSSRQSFRYGSTVDITAGDAAPSFWSTFFGRYTRNAARSARLQRAQEQGRRAGSRRHARLPVDYQAIAPELISLDLRQQRACIRVSFSQLRAVVAPGAAGQTAAASASASSLSSLAMAFGGAFGEQMSNAVPGLSWLSWAGKYDLGFIRPPGARTDPRAAI